MANYNAPFAAAQIAAKSSTSAPNWDDVVRPLLRMTINSKNAVALAAADTVTLIKEWPYARSKLVLEASAITFPVGALTGTVSLQRVRNGVATAITGVGATISTQSAAIVQLLSTFAPGTADVLLEPGDELRLLMSAASSMPINTNIVVGLSFTACA